MYYVECHCLQEEKDHLALYDFTLQAYIVSDYKHDIYSAILDDGANFVVEYEYELEPDNVSDDDEDVAEIISAQVAEPVVIGERWPKKPVKQMSKGKKVNHSSRTEKTTKKTPIKKVSRGCKMKRIP